MDENIENLKNAINLIKFECNSNKDLIQMRNNFYSNIKKILQNAKDYNQIQDFKLEVIKKNRRVEANIYLQPIVSASEIKLNLSIK